MSVDGVSSSVREMLLQLSWSRQQYHADYHVASSNHASVQLWSLVLCAAIVSTSAAQVAVLRRLFNHQHINTKQRP